MAIIHKKITTEYFNLIESEKKKFEFRLADFDISEGDTLILEKWGGGARKESRQVLLPRRQHAC